MDFRKITYQDKELIDKYLEMYPCYGSTYSMAYLASWEYFHFGEMEIADLGDALVMRFPHGGHMNYLAELTSKENFPTLVERIFDEDNNAKVVQLDMSSVELLDKDRFEIHYFPDFDEYVYNTSDLINLAGKKYHGKRNHIKRFLTNYPDYIFRDYRTEDREEVMKLFFNWEEEKGIEINSERNTIMLMLDNMKIFGLEAAVILIDGKIVAFTLGERLRSGVAIIHIEKADSNYEGLYPVINQLFVKNHFADTEYINRQEDIGIEGLRKAKRSYYPVFMSEKCAVIRK